MNFWNGWIWEVWKVSNEDDNPDALRKHGLSPHFWLSNVLPNNEINRYLVFLTQINRGREITVAVFWEDICTLRPSKPLILGTYFYMTNLKSFRSTFPMTCMPPAFLWRRDHETNWKGKVSSLKGQHIWHPNLVAPPERTGRNLFSFCLINRKKSPSSLEKCDGEYVVIALWI